MNSTISNSVSRLVRGVGTALIVVAAIGSVAVADAGAASNPHWYAGGKLVTSPERVTATGTVPFHFGFVVGGIKMDSECATMSAGGTIENGKTESTWSGSTVTLKGCKVNFPAGNGCVIGTMVSGKGLVQEQLIFKPLKAKTATPSAIQYLPETGTTYLEFTISGCTSTWLNGTKVVSGTMTAVSTETPGIFEFVKYGSTLTFGGQIAYLTGAYRIVSVQNEWNLNVTLGS